MGFEAWVEVHWVLFLSLWLGGVIIGAFAVSTYHHWIHLEEGKFYDGDKVFGDMLYVVLWPLFGIVYGLGYGFGYAPFFLLPRWLIRARFARRERVARAEAAAKLAADGARYEVERGAHR